MTPDTAQTFRHGGELLPVTDEVVLTAVGLLDQCHDDVDEIWILGRDEFLVDYADRSARLSAIELIALAHTHYRERWSEAIEELQLAPVDR